MTPRPRHPSTIRTPPTTIGIPEGQGGSTPTTPRWIERHDWTHIRDWINGQAVDTKVLARELESALEFARRLPSDYLVPRGQEAS